MLGEIVYSSYYRGLAYTDPGRKNFRLLNGQILNRADYGSLSPYFPEGTYGSTATEIVLPDVRGSYWRGLDLGRGADVNRATRTAWSGSAPVGDALGAYQPGEMKTHTHVSGTVQNNVTGIAYSPQYQGSYAFDTSFTTDSIEFLNSSGILVSGTTSDVFDVGHVTYFAYIGVD